MFFVIKSILLFPFRFFKKLSLWKKILVIVLLVIVGIFVFRGLSGARKPQYITAKAEKSTIVEEVSETGDVIANGRTDVYSPTNGTITEVFVVNGTTAQAGDELFTIKSSATEQEKSQALAAYLTAQNTLDTAKASLYSLQSTMVSKWDTFKEMAASDTYQNSDGTPKNAQRANPEFHIAEKDWLAAESNYKKQQAVISQAQAGISSAYLLYQATQNSTVKANADGVISNLSVTKGSSVKVNSVSAPTRPLATIVNSETTEVVVSLSENDIAKVKEGQSATIEANAIPDKVFNGVVRRVDTIGTSDAGVIRYNAYVEVIDGGSALLPGMNVDVTITTEKLTNVLAVPNAAVKPYKGGRAVRVPGKKGEIEYIPVTIGIRGTEKTHIKKGIKEGQVVITSLPNDQLKRGGLFGN